MVMFMAAYDASMDSRKAFLSVGGFVSSVADWTDFDGDGGIGFLKKA